MVPNEIDTSAGYQPDMGGAPADGSAQNANPVAPGGQPQGQDGGQPAAQPNPAGGQPDAAATSTQNGQASTDTPQDAQPKGDRLAALVNQRRDSRSETADLRQQVAGLQDSVSKLSPQTQQEAAAWQNPHDPTEAPMDHLRAEIDHLGGVVSQATQDVGQQLEQQQQHQALADYERGLTMEIGTVAQQVPELAQAHHAVAQHFMRNAQMQGLSGVALGNAARNAMLGAYLQHAQAGTDPVAATVQMAQAIGFQAGAQQAPGGILGAAGAQPGGQPAPNAQQQQIARGQMAAATSLGGATGSSGATSPPDLASLTRMSRAQLTANGGENMKRLKAMLRGEV